MAKLITLNKGEITNNNITYNGVYLEMTSLIIVNKNIYLMSHILML